MRIGRFSEDVAGRAGGVRQRRLYRTDRQYCASFRCPGPGRIDIARNIRSNIVAVFEAGNPPIR